MRDHHDDATAVARAVQALAGIMLGDGRRDSVLGRACEAARLLIPGVDEASVTLLEDSPRTVAASGDLALRADEAQYAAGQGPCLEAARGGRPVIVDNLAADERWPAYASVALGVGVGASLSVPLELAGASGSALNIYARHATAPVGEVVDAAVELATFVSNVAALSNDRLRALTLVQQMQDAMQFRAIIEQAKGIVMRDRGCSADEAFEVLVRRSQESHLKLRDVAQHLVGEVAGGRG